MFKTPSNVDPSDRLSDNDYVGAPLGDAMPEPMQTRSRSEKPHTIIKLHVGEAGSSGPNNTAAHGGTQDGPSGPPKTTSSTAPQQLPDDDRNSNTARCGSSDETTRAGPATLPESHTTANLSSNPQPAPGSPHSQANDLPATPLSMSISESNTSALRDDRGNAPSKDIVDLTLDDDVENVMVKKDVETENKQLQVPATSVDESFVWQHTTVLFFDDEDKEVEQEPFSKCQSSTNLFAYAKAHFASYWARGERSVLLAKVNGGKSFSIVQGDADHYERLMRNIKEDECWKGRGLKSENGEETTLCNVRVPLV